MSSSMSSGGNLAQSVAERLADQIQVLTKRHVVVFSSIYISSMFLFIFFVVEKNKPLYDNDWVLPSQIYLKEAFWSIPLLDYLLGLPPVVQFFAILFHLFWPMILHVSMFFFYYWILEIEQLFSMRKSSTSDPSTQKINSHISATATFFFTDFVTPHIFSLSL